MSQFIGRFSASFAAKHPHVCNRLSAMLLSASLLAFAGSAFALTIIPHFTAGVLVKAANGSWNPVICSTDPNNPTPTPTGANVFVPLNYALFEYGVPLAPSTVATTSCMTPQEMAAVQVAIHNIESVVATNMTVNIEYYDSPLIGQLGFGAYNSPLLYEVVPNDPVHNPGAAYTAIHDRLQLKALLNVLTNTALGGPFSVNTTFLLPTYQQLMVEYSQSNNYFIPSDYLNNNPLYPQSYTTGTDNLNPSISKPVAMILFGGELQMLTDNGQFPLPGVTVSLVPGAQYINTLTNVTGGIANGTGVPQFYSETDPLIEAQQKEIPEILASFAANGANGIIPPGYNQGGDFLAGIMHETIEELGKDSVVTELADGIAIPGIQYALSVMDMYEIAESAVSGINSPLSYANTARVQQYVGYPFANGTIAGNHVLLYHLGTSPADSTKFIGEGEGYGYDYDDLPAVEAVLPNGYLAAVQQSANSPPYFYDNFGNVLASLQGEGLIGQIQQLSIQELIELNALGYGLQNVSSVVGNTCKSAPNANGTCSNLQKINETTY